MTLEEIIEETKDWPRDMVADLVNRLHANLDQQANPEVDAAWKSEIKKRLAEIDSGAIQLIPGDEVAELVRRRLRRDRP